MAFTIPNKAAISVLPGAICRNYRAGGVVNVGDTVYIAADSDLEQASGGATGTARTHGIVVAVGTFGAQVSKDGDGLSVCVFGPVSGILNTPGTLGYQSNTAGALGESAGTTSRIVGTQESADVFFVRPGVG